MLAWRVLAATVAMFQLASPVMAAISEGLLASRLEAQPVAHVESETSGCCPQVHPADCGVCRALSTPFTPSPGHHAWAPRRIVASLFAAAPAQGSAFAAGICRARAPPPLS